MSDPGSRARPRLLPDSATPDYSGPRFVLWFFALLTAMTVVRSVLHIVLPDGGAGSIATIPLDDFTARGRAAVVYVFSLWGVSQLLLGAVYVIVLLRYRSLVPLMYLTALIEYSARLVLGQFKPVETLRTAPGAIGNLVLPPLLLVLFVFSLQAGRRRG